MPDDAAIEGGMLTFEEVRVVSACRVDGSSYAFGRILEQFLDAFRVARRYARIVNSPDIS